MATKIIFILSSLCILSQYAKSQSFDENYLKQHITFLASDKLKGRGTSSKEEKIAAKYIAKIFKKIGLQTLPTKKSYLLPFSYKKSKSTHDTSGVGNSLIAYNVAGYLDNKAAYTIVIGAHYDHLGLGHDHNSLDANPENKIHNGADDNASGTAGVMALAKYYSLNNSVEPFNFLFVCFSAEELGLIGSKKFVEANHYPLTQMNYMINLDMIGRLNDSTKKVIVGGVGTSSIFNPLLLMQKNELSLKLDSSGIGPSDHTSFYLQNIPVLFFYTGQHSDYHKPSDDADKINYKGEVEVLQFIQRVIDGTLTFPKLNFIATKNNSDTKINLKVTMGVMPDYAFDGKGMRIDGVTEGKPASKANIKKGDVLLKLAESNINSVQDYMKVLSTCEKGKSYLITIKRNDEMLNLTVTF